MQMSLIILFSMFPAKFFYCLGEFQGAAGFTWAGPDVTAATIFTTSSLAQGSLEGRGRLRGRQNAHSSGGGQRVQGAERPGVGPANLNEKTNA